MVAHTVDRDPGLLQLVFRRAQLVETVADFDTDVIKPAPSAFERTRRSTDLNQQQFVMGPSGSQRCRRPVENPPNLLETQQIPIEGKGLLQILHVKHDMAEIVSPHSCTPQIGDTIRNI